MAPFLFIIAVEGLNSIMKEAVEKGVFHGCKLPNGGPTISHLQYVDDTVFIGDWYTSNSKNISRVLRCFHLSSGLKVNFNKSSLFGVGVNDMEVSSLAAAINCKVGRFPMKYLGLPIGVSMNRLEHWGPVIDKFRSKLSRWKASALSAGGRRLLCKTVLGNLSLYFFSIFKVPKKVCNKLESFRSRFF